MKYELSEQQVTTLKDIVMGVRTSYQERTLIDGLLNALSKPVIEKKEDKSKE